MIKKDEVILQVMGVRTDGVRRPLDRGQVGQALLHRPDRDPVITQDGPRLHPRTGYRHPPNLHRSATSSTYWMKREITMSIRQTPGEHVPVLDIADGLLTASDNFGEVLAGQVPDLIPVPRLSRGA